MNNAVAFRTLILLCNHHLYLVPKHFYPLERKLPTHEAVLLHFLLPSTLKTPNIAFWLFHRNQSIQHVTFGVWCLSCSTRSGYLCNTVQYGSRDCMYILLAKFDCLVCRKMNFWNTEIYILVWEFDIWKLPHCK